MNYNQGKSDPDSVYMEGDIFVPCHEFFDIGRENSIEDPMSHAAQDWESACCSGCGEVCRCVFIPWFASRDSQTSHKVESDSQLCKTRVPVMYSARSTSEQGI